MFSHLTNRLSPPQNYTLLVLALLTSSLITIYALAYPLNPNRILETWLFGLVAHRLFPRAFGILLCISALAILLYHPTASLYGRPSFGIAASLMSTNRSEALEYAQMIPAHIYLRSMVLAVFVLITAHLARRTTAPRFGWRWLLPMCALILAAAGLTARKPYAVSGFPLRVMPIEFMADGYLVPKAYFAERDKLKRHLQLKSDWQIGHVRQTYRNYVLVIGESVRSDYMSLYGFKIANTPFLARRANVVMENVFSPGPNTPISLLHTLNLSNGKEFLIQNSLIELAKAAGMHTVWLSNQGALGQYDTSVAIIGNQADATFFLKSASYDFGDEIHDNQLLPPLRQALHQTLPEDKNRLIVLHLLGSHPNPCERLQHPPRRYSNNHNTNCYIDSIRATDQLLEQVNTLLEQNGQPYSLLYFADHGLAHDKNTFPTEQSVLRHNDRYQQNYHIPFAIINSDGRWQIRNPALRAGQNLLQGFSQWLGIGSLNLDARYDFFGAAPDNDIRVLTMDRQWRALDTLADDPPPEADIRQPHDAQP